MKRSRAKRRSAADTISISTRKDGALNQLECRLLLAAREQTALWFRVADAPRATMDGVFNLQRWGYLAPTTAQRPVVEGKKLGFRLTELGADLLAQLDAAVADRERKSKEVK